MSYQSKQSQSSMQDKRSSLLSNERLKNEYRSMYELAPRSIDVHRYPKVRDEVVSVFISAMMGNIVKSWQGYPCVRKKLFPFSWLQPSPTESTLNGENEDEEEDEEGDEEGGESTRERKMSDLQDALLNSRKSVPWRGSHESGGQNPEYQSFSNIAKLSLVPPCITSQWMVQADDTSLLIEDWRFHEVDQIARIEFKNGNIYVGRISRNVMHGEGEFYWANGTVYKGSFQCGDIIGEGTIQWPSTAWYQGNFYHGYRHGYGMLVVPQSLAYVGQWIQGIRHGKGLLVYDDLPLKNCYDVTWYLGRCNGHGLRVYKSGGQYDGQWKDGLQDGHGLMIWPNGDVYIGDWVKGKMHGIGKYIWYAIMKNEFVLPARNSYYGTWSNGIKDGLGILEIKSGISISGQWKNDLKDGYAEIVCRNGIRIKGDPLFKKDHFLGYDLNKEHPWLFMITTDNLNVMKNNYSEDTSNHIIEVNSSETLDGKDESDETDDHVIKTNNQKTNSKTNKEERLTTDYPIISKFNPTTLPSEYIDLSYHLTRLAKNKDIMKQISEYNAPKQKNNIYEEFSHLGTSIHRTPDDYVKKYAIFDIKDPTPFYSFESKWVRSVILRHLPYLKKLYYDYASMLCAKPPKVRLVLLSKLLRQMFRDIKVQNKGLTLAYLDTLVKKNPSSLLQEEGSPYERIKFFQFLHYLLELSWALYGKHRIGIEKTPGVLASALEKLIEDDLKPNARNHNVRSFLSLILNKPKNLKSLLSTEGDRVINLEEIGGSLIGNEEKTQGKNIMGIGDRPCYKKMRVLSMNENHIKIPSFDQLEQLDYEQLLSSKEQKQEVNDNDNNQDEERFKTLQKDPYKLYKVITEMMSVNNEEVEKETDERVLAAEKLKRYTLYNIDVRTALKCIKEVCPQIVSGGLVVSIDFKITFLEFYEMLILCALKSIEIEKKANEKLEKMKKKAKEQELQQQQAVATQSNKTASPEGKRTAKK